MALGILVTGGMGLGHDAHPEPDEGPAEGNEGAQRGSHHDLHEHGTGTWINVHLQISLERLGKQKPVLGQSCHHGELYKNQRSVDATGALITYRLIGRFIDRL